MSDQIDIKAMTTNLEAGDGCALRNAVQNMRFAEQEQVFDKLKVEAESRTDNHLSFEKRSIPVQLPNGQDTGERIPVIDIRNDGTMIFEAFKPAGRSEKVANICRTIGKR